MKKREVITLLVLSCVLLPGALAPMLMRLRATGQKTACEAHLRGIAAGLVQYELQNGGKAWAHPALSRQTVQYVGVMSYRNISGGPIDRTESIGSYVTRTGMSPTQLTVSRFMWSLVNARIEQGDTFVCPGSSDWAAGGGDWAGKRYLAHELFDFGGWDTCSYGMQVPFGLKAQLEPRAPSSVILADKGPWSSCAEEGRSRKVPHSSPSTATHEEWAAFNSTNHRTRGQNIASLDGAVMFLDTPIADGDNIYTAWALPGTSTGNCRTGIAPSTDNPSILPSGATDTLLYP